MKDKFDRMKELIHILSEASKAYYQENRELMSNFEYDKLYDELLELEKETDTVLADSPSIHVGYELLTSLEKEPHSSPMLSLDKTKEVGQLEEWLGDQKGLETGRAYHCSYVPGRRSFKSRDPGERGSGRSRHEQCKGICKSAQKDRV